MSMSPLEPMSKNGTSALGVLAWIFSLLVVVAIAASLSVMFVVSASGPLEQEKVIVIEKGSSVSDIGNSLEKEGAVRNAFLFSASARLMAGGSLKAGEYAIPAQASVKEIIRIIREGKSIVRLFTVPEGLTSAEIIKLLNDAPAMTGVVANIPAEGTLLPETYRYDYGDNRASIMARMQKAMQEKANEIWAARDQGLPATSLQEAIALASIVEKETGKAEERSRIAGVFYNRLRIGMRLQSDPTVIYAITMGRRQMERSLTHDDLAFASPINTYFSAGIPPQPICNPGAAALEAVAHPERNNYLYFVADGSGGHAFAPDMASHERNVVRWRQIQRSSGERQ